MSPLYEILEKFENGHERYWQDLNFAQVVDGLRLGLGVYAVLDGTLKKLARAEVATTNTAEALRLALHEKAELTEALAQLEKENKELWNSELWKENRTLKAKL